VLCDCARCTARVTLAGAQVAAPGRDVNGVVDALRREISGVQQVVSQQHAEARQVMRTRVGCAICVCVVTICCLAATCVCM
jgi:hypothetical protein